MNSYKDYRRYTLSSIAADRLNLDVEFNGFSAYDKMQLTLSYDPKHSKEKPTYTVTSPFFDFSLNLP